MKGGAKITALPFDVLQSTACGYFYTKEPYPAKQRVIDDH